MNFDIAYAGAFERPPLYFVALLGGVADVVAAPLKFQNGDRKARAVGEEQVAALAVDRPVGGIGGGA